MFSVAVQHLKIAYPSQANRQRAIYDLSFTLRAGERLGLIGESGSGKTTVARALMGLIRDEHIHSGDICYDGVSFLRLKESERNRIRWNQAALMFQNGLHVLNPVLTLSQQIVEPLIKHKSMDKKAAYAVAADYIRLVQLEEDIMGMYPHQLSGGMRQRFLLAMALACEPQLVILDEPTTAMDTQLKQEIITLIDTLQRQFRFALLVISHEFPVIQSLTDKLIVLDQGQVMEEGHTSDLLQEPQHPYTLGLIQSSPELNPYLDLWGIPSLRLPPVHGGCTFYNRCTQAIERCATERPELQDCGEDNHRVSCLRGGIVTLLQANKVSKRFGKRTACHNCSISIRAGEAVALIGQSGSGKSTLGLMLAGLLLPDCGEILFENEPVKMQQVSAKMHGIQMVLQDPYSAISPSFRVKQAIQEPLDVLKQGSQANRLEQVKLLLQQVQLPNHEGFLDQKCSELSGGQLQRVAIARSLILQPKLLIADEIHTMLDPSTQANVMRLLKRLQNEKGFSLIFITHNLSLARKVADRFIMMEQGTIIENQSALEFIHKRKAVETKSP
ncbi:ABC transporter ATP-binding protein [Paenibacillus sp. WQ 127069]|uniref:ABC transporter ATP-binding protein n=1 Tax=Paenibacillus baimaensis TaxID=2982185 RepID=A0ABT2UDX4_9BACL|nr:ABC transporter ATP-binding protein [Paenibacillus sp. WQ 127069]MCU6792802.1 ABC transporter ATP-binding protein [Paenibacillus sp. WQ 127069]